MSGGKNKTPTGWFHFFRAVVASGQLAEMGPYGLAVYVVVKCHAGHTNGKSWPSIPTIAAEAGISEAQVKRARKKLENMGLLEREKVGRKNVYRLRERWPVWREGEDDPCQAATWHYIPAQATAAQNELGDWLAGKGDQMKLIQIENLTIQVQVGDGNTQVSVSDLRSPEIQRMVAAMLVKAGEPAPMEPVL